MDNLFLIKLAISFLIGASWVTLVTVIAERYGTRIGGLIAGLPSTILFTLFFVAWTQSPNAASTATGLSPLMSGFTTIFILIYILLVRKNFWLALFSAIFVWLVCSISIVFSKFQNFSLSIIVYLIVLAICYSILEKFIKLPSQKGKKTKYTIGNILFRALISGSIISLATLLAKIGGPILGGVVGIFPAMFTSTILITYFSQGSSFSASIMKSTMISNTSIVLYVIVARWSYLHYGLITGTLIPVLVSFAYGYLLYQFVIKKIS